MTSVAGTPSKVPVTTRSAWSPLNAGCAKHGELISRSGLVMPTVCFTQTARGAVGATVLGDSTKPWARRGPLLAASGLSAAEPLLEAAPLLDAFEEMRLTASARPPANAASEANPTPTRRDSHHRRRPLDALPWLADAIAPSALGELARAAASRARAASIRIATSCGSCGASKVSNAASSCAIASTSARQAAQSRRCSDAPSAVGCSPSANADRSSVERWPPGPLRGCVPLSPHTSFHRLRAVANTRAAVVLFAAVPASAGCLLLDGRHGRSVPQIREQDRELRPAPRTPALDRARGNTERLRRLVHRQPLDVHGDDGRALVERQGGKSVLQNDAQLAVLGHVRRIANRTLPRRRLLV